MKERLIKAKALKELIEDGWVCWCPPKVRYLKECDILGAFDCIALKQDLVRLIQWTTDSNKAARIKKVLDFIKRNRVYPSSFVSFEVWAYYKNKKEFKTFLITNE